ncbi:MAG: glycine cleavage system aminomethyltransferase GcvT [Armatimonadetes bacterium]|nr:glycine cleavage system aminomethyltransferase GcvT [Armatimonadota bacterium]
MSEGTMSTCLVDEHRTLGARMVPFAGWNMPVQYKGIIEETQAVRNHAGAFDISHMGRLIVSGRGAAAFLDALTTNHVAALEVGHGHYSMLTNEAGGIIDDIIVYRIGQDEFLVVVNASNAEKDLTWLRQHAGAEVEIADQSGATGMVAVQGPDALEAAGSVLGRALGGLPRFGVAFYEWRQAHVTVCRTGYTGEDGVEVIVPVAVAPLFWRALLAAGVVPCGLGARDALRVEAGYPLYGHEIDDEHGPVGAMLMWAVCMDKGDFVGRGAIAAARQEAPKERLVGLVASGRVVPRQGYTLWSADECVGTVTSGAFTPTRGCGIAMGYVRPPHHVKGGCVQMDVRGQRHELRVIPKKELLLPKGAPAA